jgi:hypothetical protein
MKERWEAGTSTDTRGPVYPPVNGHEGTSGDKSYLDG